MYLDPIARFIRQPPTPGHFHVEAATKHAFIGFGLAGAAANEATNIRVNVIYPGVTDTQIVPNE
ncbi:MAG: SDR family NAD(P)-dependent oxidoreductase [Gammaproteobacteria bacterium]|nr:SDR family NAD(P)-dependent oxidoreductase [Gammaproteobacteria bacterium]